MKYNFDLINPYRPRNKCGTEVGIAAVVASSLFGAMTTQAVNEQNVDLTLSENEKNRRFNSQEAQKQRDWQSQEWQHQFDTQSQEWYNQLDYSMQQGFDLWQKQQEYASPGQQVSRLQSAGFNPSAMLGSNLGAGMSSATIPVQSPSIPTGGTVSGSAASAPPTSQFNMQNPFSVIQQVGDTVANLMKANRDKEEAKRLQATFSDFVEKFAAERKNVELVNIQLEIHNKLDALKAPAEIQQAWQQVVKQSTEYLQAQHFYAQPQTFQQNH